MFVEELELESVLGIRIRAWSFGGKCLRAWFREREVGRGIFRGVWEELFGVLFMENKWEGPSGNLYWEEAKQGDDKKKDWRRNDNAFVSNK